MHFFKLSLKLVMEWLKWDRLKAEVSSVLHGKFPVADPEATSQPRSWMGVLLKGFLTHSKHWRTRLQGKQNEGTERSIVYNVYNGKKLVLCVFDKLSCPLRAEMPKSFMKIY